MAYTLIATQTLTAAAASVTFSSIPATYKDLVLEMVAQDTASAYFIVRFNGDTASNYSRTVLRGNGSAASSFRGSNETAYYASTGGSADKRVSIANIMSYASTNVFKTVVARENADSVLDANATLWRKSPAEAITSIAINGTSGSSIGSGSVFRLWGVS